MMYMNYVQNNFTLSQKSSSAFNTIYGFLKLNTFIIHKIMFGLKSFVTKLHMLYKTALDLKIITL